MHVAVIREPVLDVPALVERPQTLKRNGNAFLLVERIDSRAHTQAGPFLQALAASEIFAELRRQFLCWRPRVERPPNYHFVAGQLEALDDLGNRGCMEPEASADFRLALLYLREVREGAIAGVDDPPVVFLSENLAPHHPDFQDFRASLLLAGFAPLEPGLQFQQFLLQKWACNNIVAQVRQLFPPERKRQCGPSAIIRA